MFKNLVLKVTRIMNIFFSERIMKTQKESQNFCHFHHDYEQQQHNVTGRLRRGGPDGDCIAIDAEQSR